MSFPNPELHQPSLLKLKRWSAQVAYNEEDMAISMMFRLVKPTWKTLPNKMFSRFWVHGDYLKTNEGYQECHTKGRCHGQGKNTMVFTPEKRVIMSTNQ